MPQGDQSLKPKVFLSYTGSQRDVARSFKAQLVRWGFEEVFDWIDDPVRAGPLWATMEEKLDAADVLVSFICEDYGDKIAGRELNWFTENSNSDQKRTILVFLHKDGKAWWKGLDLPDPLQDLVQNRLYDETSGRRRPPHKVDESGVIRGDNDDYQKFYRDVIDYLNEWWAEKPEPETKPEPDVGKDIMVVMGSCEGSLSDQAGEGRETLLSALQAEAAQGDIIVLDDNWGAPRKRNPIIAQMTAHPNRNRQALLVAPQPLDEMFDAGYGKVVFDEVQQVLGYGAPEKPRLASPFVWLPGYSHDQLGEITCDDGFNYVSGSADDIRDIVRGALGLFDGARIFVQDTIGVEEVGRWLDDELPKELGHPSSEPERFIGADTLSEILACDHEQLRDQPIIIACTDQYVKRAGRSRRDFEREFQEQVARAEEVIEEVFRKDDQRQVFRVFAQFKHPRYATSSLSVNQRRWPVIRFTSRRPVEICEESKNFTLSHYSEWVDSFWPGLAARGQEPA